MRILPAERVLNKYPNSATWVYNNYSITDRASISPNSRQPNKYYLSVLGMVKDDAGILSEWIEHHLAHGVEHIFVVDDKSTDGTIEILKPYAAKGLVTIYDPPFAGLGYRQAAAYKVPLQNSAFLRSRQIMLSYQLCTFRTTS